MNRLWIMGPTILIASLLIPARALTQQALTEVVLARDLTDSEPVNPFEPGAHCEKASQPSGPLPVVNSQTEPRVVLWNRIDSSGEGVIRHTWYKDDAKVAEVDLTVGVSPRWRTWSSKRIVPQVHAGKWKVVISTAAAPTEALCVVHFTVE